MAVFSQGQVWLVKATRIRKRSENSSFEVKRVKNASCFHYRKQGIIGPSSTRTADKLYYISSEYNLSCYVQEPITFHVVTDARIKIYFCCNNDHWTFIDRALCFWTDGLVKTILRDICSTIPPVPLDIPASRSGLENLFKTIDFYSKCWFWGSVWIPCS